MKKYPNHLASCSERIANAKLSLPKKLWANYEQLQQQTTLVRNALQGWLPDNIIAQCQVVESSPLTLTLMVSSHTVAAHLRHLSAIIIERLTSYHTNFSQLHTLKIHVYNSNNESNSSIS